MLRPWTLTGDGSRFCFFARAAAFFAALFNFSPTDTYGAHCCPQLIRHPFSGFSELRHHLCSYCESSVMRGQFMSDGFFCLNSSLVEFKPCTSRIEVFFVSPSAADTRGAGRIEAAAIAGTAQTRLDRCNAESCRSGFCWQPSLRLFLGLLGPAYNVSRHCRICEPGNSAREINGGQIF